MGDRCHLLPGDWVQGDGKKYTARLKFQIVEIDQDENGFIVRPIGSSLFNGYNVDGLVRIPEPTPQSSLDVGRITYDDVTTVTIEEINKQRELGWPDFHPEDFCHRCGNRNINWWTDSDRFNLALGHYAIDPEWQGIICVSCFVELHKQKSKLTTCWKLEPGMFKAAEND